VIQRRLDVFPKFSGLSCRNSDGLHGYGKFPSSR